MNDVEIEESEKIQFNNFLQKILCPNCKKPITFEAISKTDEFFNLIKNISIERSNKRFENIKLKLVSDEKQKWEKTQKIQLLENTKKIQEEYNKKINITNIQIANLKSELTSIKEKRELEIKTKLNIESKKIEEKYTSIIETKNNKIIQLETAEKLNIEKSKTKLSESIKNIQEEYNKKLMSSQTLVSNLKSELTSLKDNKELELKQEVSIKGKEIEEKYTSIIENKNQKINELEANKKINDEKFKTKLLESEQRLSKEFISKKNELDEKYQKELKIRDKQILDLKIANEKNKIIHSKTKGENLEDEVNKILHEHFMDENTSVEKTTVPINRRKPDFLINRKSNNFESRIIYEVKNLDKFNKEWLPRLESNRLNFKGDYAILIFNNADVSVQRLNGYDNIYICNFESFVYMSRFLLSLIEKEKFFKKTLIDEARDEKIKKIEKWKQINVKIKEYVIKEIQGIDKNLKDARDNIEKSIKHKDDLLSIWNNELLDLINMV